MNQQHDDDEHIKTQSLQDLPLSDEQAEETTAGAVFVGYSGGVRVGAVDR